MLNMSSNTAKNFSQSSLLQKQDKLNNFLESTGVCEELDDAASVAVNGGSPGPNFPITGGVGSNPTPFPITGGVGSNPIPFPITGGVGSNPIPFPITGGR